VLTSRSRCRKLWKGRKILEARSRIFYLWLYNTGYSTGVSTAGLQERSVVIYANITTLAIHTLSCFLIVPNVCIEVFNKKRGFLVLTVHRRRTPLIPSAKSRYCAVDFGLYTGIEHRKRSNNSNLNMHTFHPSVIDSTTPGVWNLFATAGCINGAISWTGLKNS